MKFNKGDKMMNEKKVDKADSILEDFISILLSLNSRLDWYILRDLSEREKKFSELAKDLDVDDKKLADHLEKLVKHGIITHYYKYKFLNPDYSFYALSSIGRKIIGVFDFSDKQAELKKEIRV